MFERMGKQKNKKKKWKQHNRRKTKKMDKTTAEQNTTPYPKTPNTRTTIQRLGTRIQDENKKTYNKF